MCIGTNDSWFPTKLKKYNPALSVEKFHRNLVEIIEFLLKNGLSKEKILLISPPTLVAEQWNEFAKRTYNITLEKTPEHTRKYVDATLEVGKQLDIKTFDLFELTSREEHFNRTFVDGVHFTKYGADLMFEFIKDDVEQLVEKQRQTKRENFPTFFDADFNHPEAFFTAEPSGP